MEYAGSRFRRMLILCNRNLSGYFYPDKPAARSCQLRRIWNLSCPVRRYWINAAGCSRPLLFHLPRRQGRIRRMIVMGLWWFCQAASGSPALPARPAGAPGGKTVAQVVAGFDLAAREAVLEREILSGNVPEFWRQFVPLTVKAGPDLLILQVASDYLAVGRETDFFQTPLTPGTAWRIADRLDCVLPTRKMVDLIHAAAPLKLPPTPRPPGPGMTTVADFLAYQETVHHQRLAALSDHPWGTLTAGHHKDLVSTPRLAGTSGKVAIYGWHRPDGTPVQPLYTGHADTWVDYSHGVRLVGKTVILNGRATTVEQILTDPGTAQLLSDEPLPATASSPVPVRTEAVRAAAFGETLLTLEPERGVRVVVNRPAAADPDAPSG